MTINAIINGNLKSWSHFGTIAINFFKEDF